MSETAKHRYLFLPYCQGNGLDIGFGGDPIVDTAITFDLPERYSHVGDKPQHIKGNAQSLYMFNDKSLDYIYSSHCIEDFIDTWGVLVEWLRVLKIGGLLCLLFPDEKIYRTRTPIRNIEHKHNDFSLAFLTDTMRRIDKAKRLSEEYGLEIVLAKEMFDNNDYNCALIMQKVRFDA